MVLVLPVCMRSPFRSSHMPSACGSGISSLVTIHGPVGPKVSQPLPLSQVPPRSVWKLRSETSFTTQYPATGFIASASDTYLALVPITMPSSTSQSGLVEPLGITTSSFGPWKAPSDFRKMIGSVGGVAPVSAAWSA